MKSLLSKVKMPGSKSKHKNKNRTNSTSNSETNSETNNSSPKVEQLSPESTKNNIEELNSVSKDAAPHPSQQEDAVTTEESQSPINVVELPSSSTSNSETNSESNNPPSKVEQLSLEPTENSIKEVNSAIIDAAPHPSQQEDAVTTEESQSPINEVELPSSSAASSIKNEEENTSPHKGSNCIDSEESKEEQSCENKEESVPSSTDVDVVGEVLKKLDLDSPSISAEEKIKELCVVFKASVSENVKYKEASRNIVDQLEKNEHTKEALQKLCAALKTQVDLKCEEGELKLREETQKRIDATTSFQTVISDLSVLVEKHNGHNRSLQEENQALATKLKELLQAHEKREDKIESVRTEFNLQYKLFEAQLAKAKLEKAEVSADFNKERLELQKQIMESDEQMMLMLNREELLKEQVEIYQKQYSEMEKNIGGTTKNFQHFRKEIERVTKELKKVERDTEEWKAKFEDSQTLVKKMNSQNFDREKEFEGLNRKFVAMEKLNRHLSQERTNLLKQIEEKEQKQPNGDSTEPA